MAERNRMGSYRILQRIGRGGAGQTFLALHESSTRESTLVACIKAPKPVFAQDPRYVADFENEARMASLLSHPHILSLRERGVDERGIGFLVYPYVEGLDLGELVDAKRERREQLVWQIVAVIALELARALEYAHRDTRGSGRLNARPPIVHRDVCPQNILLGLSGICYLIDFGIAKALENAALIPSLAGSGRFLYSAPERLFEGSTYDARADLFSLGVVLFEALTNVRPYDADGTAGYLRQVFDSERPRIRGKRVDFHSSTPEPDAGLKRLAELVEQLISPNPDDRPPSAAALADALSEITIPNWAHREMVRVAEDHWPEWRRNVRIRAGESLRPPAPPIVSNELWSAADPQQLTSLLAAEPAGLERDLVRVSPEGARRLLAQRHIPLATTQPGHSADPGVYVSLDSTVPDRPAFPTTTPLATPPESLSGRAPQDTGEPVTKAGVPGPVLTPPPMRDAEPPLSETRDQTPPIHATPPTSSAAVVAARSSSSPSSANSSPPGPAPRELPPPHPFTQAATSRPAFDLDSLEGRGRHAERPAPAPVRHPALIAVAVFALMLTAGVIGFLAFVLRP